MSELKEPTEAQRQATDFVLKHIEMYKKDKDRYNNEWYGDEHIWYIFTEDFEGWTEERFRLAKKSVNKELRRTLRYRGLKVRQGGNVARILYETLGQESW
ncbi:hypothetical protein HYFRA_00004940 [Hymenoscyphus fraxineus]|uniref:Uncharacterized protein n=1 Tax=Hymenoscyphus fraxineus TaxID=746836 RepID=A0A9N9KL67_9HELO|nr:hypothetical protein HYFRA_00004940 [Hymenoscyphus fraxineus]